MTAAESEETEQRALMAAAAARKSAPPILRPIYSHRRLSASNSKGALVELSRGFDQCSQWSNRQIKAPEQG